jgi:HlyD family secretion protein
MRTWVIVVVVLVSLAGAVAAGYKPAMQYWEQQNAPKWKTADVAQGDIVSVVNATGTIKPVTQVAVGSFVSGPIDPEYQLRNARGELMWKKKKRSANGSDDDGEDEDLEPKYIAEFNEEVKKDDMLAKVQETIYRANLDRDLANLKTREAERDRIDALVEQAARDLDRVNRLVDEQKKDREKYKDTTYIAQGEIDKVFFGLKSLRAQRDLAAAAVDQARAQLAFSEAQLKYTNIVAPVDGIIINRKIDPGQTVAAQFQTPELFVIGPEMREHMYVHASVDEADIGLIHDAKKKSLPVSFTVDAYPELFKGWIEEIRLSSTTTQNVVTYTVVVETEPNPDLKLLPGMTANISFEVDSRTDVVKIPNSALRFFPQPQHVRIEDKPLLEGKQDEKNDQEVTDTGLSADDRATARKNRNRRHVWVQNGSKLRAVEVNTGLSDSRYTELVSGDLKKGDKLVIGIQPSLANWGQ